MTVTGSCSEYTRWWESGCSLGGEWGMHGDIDCGLMLMLGWVRG